MCCCPCNAYHKYIYLHTNAYENLLRYLCSDISYHLSFFDQLILFPSHSYARLHVLKTHLLFSSITVNCLSVTSYLNLSLFFMWHTIYIYESVDEHCDLTCIFIILQSDLNSCPSDFLPASTDYRTVSGLHGVRNTDSVDCNITPGTLFRPHCK